MAARAPGIPDELTDVIRAIQAAPELTAPQKQWFVDFIRSFGASFNEIEGLKRRWARREITDADYERRIHDANVEWRGELDLRLHVSLSPAEREWCRILRERANSWLMLWDWM